MVEQASLLQDLELLPDGDLTEVLPQTFKFPMVSFLLSSTDWRKGRESQWWSEAAGTFFFSGKCLHLQYFFHSVDQCRSCSLL